MSNYIAAILTIYRRMRGFVLGALLCLIAAMKGTEMYYASKETKIDPAAVEASVQRIFDRFGIDDDAPGLTRFMAWQAERGAVVLIPARIYRVRSTVVIPSNAFVHDSTFIGSRAADPVIQAQGELFIRNTVISGGNTGISIGAAK